MYGTLRTSGRLRRYYNLETRVLKDTVKGFYLINSGYSYPIAYKGDSSDTLIVEVTECDDKEFTRIELMEKAAGYETITVTTDSGISGKMFVQKEGPNKDKIYDWIEYAKTS